MVRFRNTCIIFTTSRKNQNEVRDVLTQNFNLIKKGWMNQYMMTDKGDDDGQADDQEYSEAERAVLEQRDSVEPLLDYSGNYS